MKHLIELPVSELKTALTGLTKIACRTSRLPVLQSIRVARDKAGLVNLQATDLDSFATYQTEQPQPGPACEFLVPLESLNKLVRKSSGKANIGLIGEEGGRATIRTFVGNSPVDQTVPSVEAKEWPPTPTVDQTPIALNDEFREAVAAAFDCCSTDSTRASLNGAWVDVSDPKAHYVFGTDGRHLVTTNSFCLDLRDSVLIPQNKFLEWNGFREDGDWKLAVQKLTKKDEETTWLQFQSNHWTFLHVQPEVGPCPNWRQAVHSETTAKTSLRLSQEAVDFLLELLPKLPGYDGRDEGVCLEIEHNTLTVKGKSKDSPKWTAVVVPGVSTAGDPVSIHLNRQYMIKALKFGLVEVDLIDALSPLLFKNGGRRLVVMPLRPEATTSEPAQPEPAQASPGEVAKVPSPVQADQTNNPNPEPERNEAMAKTTTETTAVETPALETGVKTLFQHVEQIKESLKGVIRNLNDLLDVVRKAEKEKRSSEKDIEAVREKLREIQSVKL